MRRRRWSSWRRGVKSEALMVGFNRRFAPLYQELKGRLGGRPRCGWISTAAIAWATICFTLLDDYLHVVDTRAMAGRRSGASARWRATDHSPQGEMLRPNTSSVRPGCRSPPACTAAQAASASGCRRLRMAGYMPSARCAEWQEECGHGVSSARSPAGNHPEQRGFAGCARHFIECVQNQTVPETAGEQAPLASSSGWSTNFGATPSANNPL